MDANKGRVNFGGKLSTILVAAGSAVGLGNIWRFPYEVGNHGGAAFILIYILCIIFMGLPIMIAEFSVGRYTRSNTVGAMKRLAPHSLWRFTGYLPVLAAFLILSYYVVVAGWTLEYTYRSIVNGFVGLSSIEYAEYFSSFSSDAWRPLLWAFIFLLLTHVVIVLGVKKGIEQSAKMLMPLLFILIVVLAICSLTLPDAGEGLKFLFQPDFSEVTPDVFLGAMGQAFYSLSLGMGCLMTYSSYFDRNANLPITAANVAIIDTCIAIIAGLIIFPAAFSVGVSPDSGPSLLFITLPNVFQLAFGDMQVLSYILTLMFYLLLALAALTSTISLHEVVTLFVHEEWHLSRSRAATLVTSGCLFLGIFASLSLGILADEKLFGLSFFDLLDMFTSKIMLPLAGMFTSIFVGWHMERRVVLNEISNRGCLRVPYYKTYLMLLKYVAPTAIAFIFINGLME